MTVILAIALLAMSADRASADPISAAIVGFMGLTGTAATIATSALTLALSFGASVGLSLLQRALAGRPSAPIGGTTGKLQSGGIVPRSIPFGRTVVTHSLIYHGTYGRVGKTPNAYLAQVFQLADVPCNGLAEIWVNGAKCTIGTTPNADGMFPVTEFFKPEANGRASIDHLWVRFYDGTQTTPDAFMRARFGSDADYPYDAGRIGAGCPYVVVVARANQEVFSGFPQFKFVVNGARLYDPRLDSTNGGSGSQRWADQSTWTFTENPAVVAYNVLRGISYGGRHLFGGQTIGVNQLPVSSWFAAMNECDVLVSLAGGGTERQYRCGGEITTEMKPTDVIERLMAACSGRVVEIGGIYKVRAGAPGAAVMTITDADILSSETQTFEPFKAIGDRANVVTAKYIEPGQGWTAKDAPILYSDTYVAEDGKITLAPLVHDYVPFGVQVQRLMKSALEENRRERKHKLPLPMDAWPLEPGDTIAWTSARNGYTNKLFRVDAVNDGAAQVIGLDLTEVDPADFNWSPSTDQKPIIVTAPVTSTPVSQAASTWTATGVTITGATGRSVAAIRFTWDTDTEDVSGVQFEVWNADQTAIIHVGETDRWDIGSADVSQNVVSSTSYRVRWRYRPTSARQTSWSGYVTVTTPFIAVPPPDDNSLQWAMFADEMKRTLGAPSDAVRQTSQAVERLGRIVNDLTLRQFDAQATLERSIRVTSGDIRASVDERFQVAADEQAGTASAVSSLAGEVQAARGGSTSLSARFDVVNAAWLQGDQAEAAARETLTATVAGNTSAINALATTKADASSVSGTVATVLTQKFGSLASSGYFRISGSLGAGGALSEVLLGVSMSADGATPADGVIRLYGIAKPGGGWRTGVDIQAEVMRWIDPANNVRAFWDATASRFTLDTISVRNARISGVIDNDRGVEFNAPMWMGQRRALITDRTRFAIRFYTDATVTPNVIRTAYLRLEYAQDNLLFVSAGTNFNVLPTRAFQLQSGEMFPSTPAGFVELPVDNFGFLRLWADGTIEAGDYQTGTSNWLTFVARQRGIPPWDMDPRNSLNATRFLIDEPVQIVVPQGVAFATMKGWGMGGFGGDMISSGRGYGGAGGYGSCKFPVTPGERLWVTVPMGSSSISLIRPVATNTNPVPVFPASNTNYFMRTGEFHAGPTGFGGSGRGPRGTTGTQQRHENALPGGGALIISRGPPSRTAGNVICVIPGGGSAIGPYHGGPGGLAGWSGGAGATMRGLDGTFSATAIWGGGGGGWEGGGQAANQGAWVNATECFPGHGGTFFFAPQCTNVVQLSSARATAVAPNSSAAPPNTSDADYVATGQQYGFGGGGNTTGGVCPPGGQGFCVLEFTAT